MKKLKQHIEASGQEPVEGAVSSGAEVELRRIRGQPVEPRGALTTPASLGGSPLLRVTAAWFCDLSPRGLGSTGWDSGPRREL